jgi:hypothetical protein
MLFQWLHLACNYLILGLQHLNQPYGLRLGGSLVTELYDVVVLSGVRQPMALGFKSNEIERMLLVDEERPLR